MQDQLKKGSATMSDDAKSKLMRDIDSANKDLQRDSEDFEADVQQEEGKIMQELGTKVMDVIVKYATQNGYAMVLDVSNPQTRSCGPTPASTSPTDIVKLYDQAHPGTGGAAPATAPAKPASPPAGTAKPPAPQTKKQ